MVEILHLNAARKTGLLTVVRRGTFNQPSLNNDREADSAVYIPTVCCTISYDFLYKYFCHCGSKPN